MDSCALSEEIITRLLAQPNGSTSRVGHRFSNFFHNPAQPAAVLIPFLRPFGPCSPWHILLTRRTHDVADHKGQVAFPGGRSEPSDSTPQDTALREAWEEIGLDPLHVRILGTLASIQTISNYRITPVIAVIPWPYEFRLQFHEVSRIFILPLSWLADPANWEVRKRSVAFPNRNDPVNLEVFFYKSYTREVLWGVSAEIVQALIARLGLNNNRG